MPDLPFYQRDYAIHELPDVADDVKVFMLQAAAQAMTREAEQVIEFAQENTVPVETGRLAGSGVVLPAEVSKDSAVVEFGFGGVARDYAVYVHEDPVARHGAEIGKPAGQGWKYLERPTLAASEGLGERIAESVERDLS